MVSISSCHVWTVSLLCAYFVCCHISCEFIHGASFSCRLGSRAHLLCFFGSSNFHGRCFPQELLLSFLGNPRFPSSKASFACFFHEGPILIFLSFKWLPSLLSIFLDFFHNCLHFFFRVSTINQECFTDLGRNEKTPAPSSNVSIVFPIGFKFFKVEGSYFFIFPIQSNGWSSFSFRVPDCGGKNRDSR